MAEKHLKKANRVLGEMLSEQQRWLPVWRELNKFFYPFMYQSLYGPNSGNEQAARIRNTSMLDGAAAHALYVLAAGFMNGVTSPARKWFKITDPAAQPYADPDAALAEANSKVRKKLLEIFAASNYYDQRAQQVYDGCGLGTSVLLCYEDRDTVVKFKLLSPGTYALRKDSENRITKIGREFVMKGRDLIEEFGLDAVPKALRDEAKLDDVESLRNTNYTVRHLIEANEPDKLVPSNVKFRELYWLASRPEDGPEFLATRPLWEWPAGVFRWATPDDSTYGIPPTVGVVGKAAQLQNMELKTDQGLDKMVSPPLLADIQLQNRPKAFAAGGITFTPNLGSASEGARPLLNMQIPFQELQMKRQAVIEDIEEQLFNPLFNMVSQLDTVRSATEIDARREEKLVMLGPVLTRGYNEDLFPIVARVFGIASRKGLFADLAESPGSVEFSNILSDVQKASDVATIERFFGFVGSLLGAFPELQQKVNPYDLLQQYAEGLGIRPTGLRSDDEAGQGVAQQNQMAQLQQVSEVAKNFSGAAAPLLQDGSGGGMAAVQQLLAG